MRKRPYLALPVWLLLWLVLLPGLAAAAPLPTGLAQYTAMLQQGIADLEQADQLFKANATIRAAQYLQSARPFLAGAWRIETPHGLVEADLSDFAPLITQAERSPDRYMPILLDLARDHLRAAQQLAQVEPADAPGARQTLAAALQKGAAVSLLERIQQWWRSFLGQRVAAPLENTPRETYYVGGVIAVIALGYLGYQLYRTLTRNATPEAALTAGKGARPDRPATPAELRQRARQLSERGEHLAGLRTAHLALLQQYDAIKLIRYVPAQTNREHEWQLRRRHPDLARTLRSLNNLVDDRLYSGHGATAEDFLTVDALVDQLWREGNAASRSAEATTGASLSASSP